MWGVEGGEEKGYTCVFCFYVAGSGYKVVEFFFMFLLVILVFFFGGVGGEACCVCVGGGGPVRVLLYLWFLYASGIGFMWIKIFVIQFEIDRSRFLFWLRIAARIMEGIKELNMSLPSANIFELFFTDCRAAEGAC